MEAKMRDEKPRPSIILALTKDEAALVKASLLDLSDKIASWQKNQRRWFFQKKSPFIEKSNERLHQIETIIKSLS